MAKKEKPAQSYTKTLIRTVSHYEDNESESLLHVNTTVYENERSEFNYQHIQVEDPDGEFQWITINSEAQAKELFRAIQSAGKEIGWFDD